MNTLKRLERIEIDGLKFDIRPGTSDEKAIREVVERQNYGRYGFAPEQGERWIDLGANVGAFTVWAAARGAMVEAYEPDPDMCELVNRNLRINKLINRAMIMQAAVVADGRDHVTLHCNTARGNVWRNSIERDWRGGEDIVVPAISIQTVLYPSGKNLFVKMDIEGTEMPILEELMEAKNAHLLPEAIVFEWSFDVDPSIPRFHDIIEKLRKQYKFIKGDELGRLKDLDEWPTNAFPPCRLVYCQ